MSVLLTISAQAQTTPVITEEDMARVRREQPNITDKDIKRAQKAHSMPGAAELKRVPGTAGPRIDALPKPQTDAPVDLEALSKAYALQMKITQPTRLVLGDGPILMVFISLSMPEATLKRLVNQAARAKASLLIRGLLNGSLRDTVARTQALLADQSVAFQIDPQAFERYAITQVPSFVLVRDGASSTPCQNGSCSPPNDYVRLAGDVSLDYALSHIQHRTPRFSKDVAAFIQRLKG
ncbi:MAG: type-F conjugative transfer system pilin assembly protein TrbC [Aquabacterium sp.]|uniref:type-F conjugative transfer system pilin assembly protein TrbC n=1 Tax=Aquabacterium sp. TaxID=1872578 RepID=UPI002727FB83|nr:type-F conjugative transfer system pilin assembly protein TrbC [Aquabacterium sp.]MDO9002622.1 type-F conjugative transfer system pilin assembly protein TrbC [Aquabacterium sp.]